MYWLASQIVASNLIVSAELIKVKFGLQQT